MCCGAKIAHPVIFPEKRQRTKDVVLDAAGTNSISTNFNIVNPFLDWKQCLKTKEHDFNQKSPPALNYGDEGIVQHKEWDMF